MTDDSRFDPDNFDWGDDSTDSGISLDEVGENVVEMAVAAALKAHEGAFGWSRLQRDNIKQTFGRVFKPKHVVPEEARSFFEKEWPEYTFVWDAATMHHDHPVSHLATELNELEMVHDLVANRTKYVDLYGNPHRNMKYKRVALTVYALMAPKDYLRYQYEKAGMLYMNWEDMIQRKGVYHDVDTFTCTHALYYLTMDKIAQLVNRDRRTRLRALVHRHDMSHGFLNSGELEYWVNPDGMVTQRNVLTGESYNHPSLEALFHQSSARTQSGGVTWTIRKAGGDSFFIDFVGCPIGICDDFVPLKSVKPETRSVITTAGVTVSRFLHWTWTTLAKQDGEIRLDDVDLLDKLRRYCAGKKRDSRLRTEVLNYARRLCNKADIISIHGGGAHEINVATMVDYAHAAFYMDVQHELSVALAYHKENTVMVNALNDFYDGGSGVSIDLSALQATGRSMVSVTSKAVNAVVGQQVAVFADYDPGPKQGSPFGWATWCG